MFNWLKPKASEPLRPKTLGQLGEEFAQTVYKDQGFEIIGENVFNKKGLRKGEIDFIAKNSRKIIFVEVKTRTENKSRFGSGEESVNYFKQIKLLKAVKHYLLRHPNTQRLQPQIDVCVVDFNHIDNCFKCVKIIANAVEDWN